MKPARLAVLASILCIAACSQQQTPQQAHANVEPDRETEAKSNNLTFTTNTPDFAVISTATGKLSGPTPFISVALDNHTMRANPKYQAPAKVVGYKIGLAFHNSNGQWDVARWSDAKRQNFTLQPGETRQIENAEFIIPTDSLHSLNNYWLILAIELDTNGTTGYTYAHSNRGIF